MFLSHHTAEGAGVVILLSKAFTPASFRVEHVVPERLLLKAGFNGFNVVCMNIYAPNERTLF